MTAIDFSQDIEIEWSGKKIALYPFGDEGADGDALPINAFRAQVCLEDGTAMPCGDEFLIEEFRTNIFWGDKFVVSENCTKTNLREFAAGRLVAEGIISPGFFKKDFAFYASCDHSFISIVPMDNGVLERYSAPFSEDISFKPAPMPKAEEIFSFIKAINSEKVRDYRSKIHARTQGTHCCYLWKNGEVLGEFEDISRHSAADKCIGFACLRGIDLDDAIIFSTGRAPADFIIKMQRAGVGTLVSKAVPTADGVRLARKIGLNLICKAWPDSFRIFSPESV